jgi:hypothetical protein
MKLRLATLAATLLASGFLSGASHADPANWRDLSDMQQTRKMLVRDCNIWNDYFDAQDQLRCETPRQRWQIQRKKPRRPPVKHVEDVPKKVLKEKDLLLALQSGGGRDVNSGRQGGPSRNKDQSDSRD